MLGFINPLRATSGCYVTDRHLISTRGLFGWTARVWSTEAKLLASGGGQCLYRELPSDTTQDR